jgi:outer membrane usher protein
MLTKQCARHKLNLKLIARNLFNLKGFLESVIISVPLVLALSSSSIAAVNQPQSQTEPIFLGITLNMEKKGEFMVQMTKDGDFLVKVDDLKAMGLRELPPTIIIINGEPYVSLRSSDEIEFVFDEIKLSLDITVQTRLFPKRTIDFMPERQPKVYYPNDSSAFLNYGLNYFESSPGGFHSTGLTNEVGIRTKELLFLSNSLYTKDQTEERFTRLMTNVTYDRRNDLQRVTAGDFNASSGDLGSSINLGGLSFSKIYTIDPYFIKTPLLDFSGVVSLPSVVDIYVNGKKERTEKLSPGEFDLRNLRTYGGTALIEVVIKDPFGREQRIKYTGYFTDVLLKEGLHEYSYNAGFLRERLGTESNDYGEVAFSLFHRYGLTQFATVGLRAEGTKGLSNIGTQGSFLAWNSGVISIAISGSRDELQGTGYAGTITYGYQSRKINGGLFLNDFSEHYTTISSRNISERIKYQTGAGIGYFEEALGSLSLNIAASQKYGSQVEKAILGSYSRNLTREINMQARLGKTIGGARDGYEFFLGINYYPGKDQIVSAGYDRKGSVNTETIQVQKTVPIGEGFGYTATVGRSESTSGEEAYSLDPLLQYNARYNILRGEYNKTYTSAGSFETGQFLVAGAVVYAGGNIGLTRPVTDSFSLVKVEDIEGVRVYNSNQEVGKTNSSGIAFIPNVNSYYENRISINDKDVPMDYSLSEVAEFVSPPFRSGSCVVFEARRFQYITGMLKIKSGVSLEPAEFVEATMKVGDKDVTFPTGRGGEFSFENVMTGEQGQPERRNCSTLTRKDISPVIIAGRYRTSFEHKGKTCVFYLVIPETKETIVDLGDVTCEEEKMLK